MSAIDLNRKSVGPDGWRRFGWLVIGTGVFVVLAVFGRWTIIDQQAVSMIWPAAGVSVLLLGMTPTRWWPVIVAVVAVATFGVNMADGTTPAQASVFAVSNVVQALTGVLVLRALAPHLVGVGGDRRLQFLRDFMAVRGRQRDRFPRGRRRRQPRSGCHPGRLGPGRTSSSGGAATSRAPSW